MSQGRGWKIVEYENEKWFVIGFRHQEGVRQYFLQAVNPPFRVTPFIDAERTVFVGWANDSRRGRR